MLALESGLPNEIEFALHILIEMSYDKDNPFLIVKVVILRYYLMKLYLYERFAHLLTLNDFPIRRCLVLSVDC